MRRSRAGIWGTTVAPHHTALLIPVLRPGDKVRDVMGAYAQLDESFWTDYHTFGLVGFEEGGSRFSAAWFSAAF